MNEKKFHRRTIRLLPFVDNQLDIIAKKNNITVNKLVSEIIMYHINDMDMVNNNVNVNSILEKLELLQNDINDLQKKYNWLNALTKQIFVNSGFARNRDLKDDTVFNDFINKRYKDNDRNYNS